MFKVGDKLRCIEEFSWKDQGIHLEYGSVGTVKIVGDNGNLSFNGDDYWKPERFELVKEPKQMKATDTVTLELTGKQLAKIYAVMGRTNGSSGSCIWGKLQDLLDPRREIYDKILSGKHKVDLMDYNFYEKSWLEALFAPEKSEAELQLEKLQEQIAQLTKEADTLKGML